MALDPRITLTEAWVRWGLAGVCLCQVGVRHWLCCTNSTLDRAKWLQDPGTTLSGRHGVLMGTAGNVTLPWVVSCWGLLAIRSCQTGHAIFMSFLPCLLPPDGGSPPPGGVLMPFNADFWQLSRPVLAFPKLFRHAIKKWLTSHFFAAQWRPHMPTHVYCWPWPQCHTFCPVSTDPDGAGLKGTPSQLCVNPAQSCLWMKEWKEVKGNRKRRVGSMTKLQYMWYTVLCAGLDICLSWKSYTLRTYSQKGPYRISIFFFFNAVNMFYFICIIMVFWPVEVCLTEYYWK